MAKGSSFHKSKAAITCKKPINVTPFTNRREKYDKCGSRKGLG